MVVRPTNQARAEQKQRCVTYALYGWTWMPVSGSHTLMYLRRLQPCNDLSPPLEHPLLFSSALETVCTSIGRLLGL